MARLFDLVIRSVWRGWLKTATLRRVKFDDLITQNQLLLSFCIGLLGTLFFSAAHFWLSWLTAIFFMVSTSFTDLSELVVNLPEAEGETLEPDKGLDIIITADGAMFLNGTSFPSDAENLRAIIIEKDGSRRDIPVSIVADGDTRHAMVVMSMDTVSQLGFKRLSISTQRPVAGE